MPQLTSGSNLVVKEVIQQRACQLYPRFMFEDARFFGPLIFLFGLVLHLFLYPHIGLNPPTWLSTTVLLVYVTASVFDTYTTQLCMGLHQGFTEMGYELPLRESNIMMPDRVTLKQNILSLPTLFSALGAFYIYFVPAVGIGATMLHACAGQSNLRARQRVLCQLELMKKNY